MLFAVCRGKVSEGIDFSDKAGRCVIIAGIPYAQKRDPKVIARLMHILLCKKTLTVYLSFMK